MKAIFISIITILFITACSNSVASNNPDVSQTKTTESIAKEYIPTHPDISLDSIELGQSPRSFLSNSGIEIRYFLYIPENFDLTIEWSLILYFHGSGGDGTSLNRIANKTLPNYIEELPEFPFIVISPQLPKGTWFTLYDPLEELLDHLINVLPINSTQLYLTGISKGGYGTWRYALNYPERFAAIAPIAGAPSNTTNRVPDDICTLNNLPIWVFHGEDDNVIKLEQTIEPVEALQSCGGNIKLTIYPETGHDAWTPTYTNPAFYDWLLQHSN